MSNENRPYRKIANQHELKQFLKSTEQFLDDTFRHFNFNQLNFNNFDFKNMFNKSIPVRVNETNTQYIVEAELPGFSKDEVHIESIKNQLKITVSKHKDHRETLERIITFPQPIQSRGIKANLKHGLLKIIVRKKSVMGRQIKIDDE